MGTKRRTENTVYNNPWRVDIVALYLRALIWILYKMVCFFFYLNLNCGFVVSYEQNNKEGH